MEEKRRGKIRKSPAPEIVEYLIKPGIAADMARSYQTILDINRAHVIMLAEEGIIKKDAAASILKATREIALARENPDFEITPDVEDLYFNLERHLICLTGMEVGGQQHTARSRNDLIATTARMDSRREHLHLCGLFLELRRALLALGRGNLETVMAGNTHLQPSEPITFAHYCSAVLNAMERDYARLSRAWQTLNICPLGGCSMASTTFPINRETTAELLGFDACMANSIDCVASRDYALEITGALATAANTFSRLAQDFYLWAAPEFSYIEVDDSLAVCSSIMPQKKNPITLEHVKAKAAHLEGFWVSVFSALKNISYTHSRDASVESMRYYWTAMQETEASIRLLTATISTLKVNKEHMVEVARKNYCTVTELANYLVRYDGLSFRAAHEVVAMLVDYMTTNRKSSDEIRRPELDAICKRMLGQGTTLSDEHISLALDPVRNAKSKRARGGSCPEEVASQLGLLEKALNADEDERVARMEKLAAAGKLLDSRTDALINF